MQTVIIGNGILALTTALRLAARASDGDKILLIGPENRNFSASLAAGAMLNSFAEIEAGGLETDLDLYRFELSHLATRMWPKFEDEIIAAAGDKLPHGCSKCSGTAGGGCFDTGTYVINNTAASQLDDENFDAIVTALEDFNEQHEFVAPSEIPNYKPEQKHRATRAVYIHNEGWFNPRLVLEKLDAALNRSEYVQYIDSKVVSLEQAADGLVSAALLEDGDRVEGDKFLLANGTGVGPLLSNSDLGINMQRVFFGVGVSLQIKSNDGPQSHCIRTPNRGLACGLYSVPFFTDPEGPNDHVLLGASNFISPEPYGYGRLTSIEGLMKGSIEQFNSNFYRADLIRVNVGWRPNSQDSYPLIGKTSIKNLIIATGTKRDGFHMSPLISEYLTKMVHDEPVDIRFDVFNPERELIKSYTREKAIETTVKHQMSAAYQHGFEPSQSRMPDQLEEMYRDKLERLHDQIGAYDWGIPPEMIDMYRYGHAKP